jgi:hypothetical protein
MLAVIIVCGDKGFELVGSVVARFFGARGEYLK